MSEYNRCGSGVISVWMREEKSETIIGVLGVESKHVNM